MAQQGTGQAQIRLNQRVINSALWLPRQTDHYVIAPVGRVAVKYVARRMLPPRIKANSVVKRVWKELRKKNSPVRLGIDSGVAYGAATAVALSILDAITPARIWGSVADFYTKHPVQAGLLTAGGLAAVVTAADVAVSAARHAYANAATRTSDLARNGAEMMFALLLLASVNVYDRFDRGPWFLIWEKPSAPAAPASPEALQPTPSPTLGDVVGATTTPEAIASQTPFAIATAEPPVPGLTQKDLEAYVTNTLLPQIQQSMDKMSEKQKEALQNYVNKFVGEYFAQQITSGGYVTGTDLAKLGQQISGQFNDLEKKIRQLGAAQATPTAVPPTSPPTPRPDVLGQYSSYALPSSLLQAAAGRDKTGLAAVLGLSVPTLETRLDNDLANDEIVRLEVNPTTVYAVLRSTNPQNDWRRVELRGIQPSAVTGYFSRTLTHDEQRLVSETR